ncbi:MAG: alkaline phosphatase D family protein [Sandaracinus sp.]
MLRDPTARGLVSAGAVVGAIALAGCGAASPAPRVDALCLENVALGEMTDHSAVLWAREPARAYLHAHPVGGGRDAVAPLLARFDHAARVRLRELEHAREVVVWASDGADASEPPPACAPRALRVAPPPHESAPVRFAFGGDVGGQNVCRDATTGFPTLAAMNARPTDFRVLLGDMIYADDTCTAEGALGNAQIPIEAPPLPSLEAYRAHWRYAEDDPGYRAMRWGAYAVWDDHEIVNDAGPHHDHVRRGRGRDVPLLPLGRRGLLEHDALDVGPLDESTPLHRRFRWGRHLELALLDTRSYRDDDGALDDAAEPKTMLGQGQRDWLAELLRSSDATWIVIVSSVPIALPTGANGRRDSWADGDTGRGFVRELRGLFEVARRAGRRQLVFVTTDVHFTAAFRHQPFADDPGFVVHELVTGPLAAGLFPFDRFDTTLGTERLLQHVPDDPVRTLEAARPYFTWGEVAIDGAGLLTLSARNADDEIWSATLAP